MNASAERRRLVSVSLSYAIIDFYGRMVMASFLYSPSSRGLCRAASTNGLNSIMIADALRCNSRDKAGFMACLEMISFIMPYF